MLTRLGSEILLAASDRLCFFITAIPSTPVLSYDESRLFASSAAPEIACLDAETGKTIWATMGASQFLAAPKVSSDDTRVYSIEEQDGRVFCQEQASGEVLWLASCDQFQTSCANSSVRSEFALSSSGQFLYYGDVLGHVIALKLGDTTAPTLAPVATEAPSPAVVTPLYPASGTGEQPAPPGKSHLKKGLTIGGSIALIIFATVIGVGSSCIIIALKRLKSVPHPQQMHDQDDKTEEDETYSQTSDQPSSPDPYEDAILSKHPVKRTFVDDASLPRSFVSPKRARFSETQCSLSPSQLSSQAIPAPQADRISVLLGTSNCVKPLNSPDSSEPEDYSFGASLLL